MSGLSRLSHEKRKRLQEQFNVNMRKGQQASEIILNEPNLDLDEDDVKELEEDYEKSVRRKTASTRTAKTKLMRGSDLLRKKKCRPRRPH